MSENGSVINCVYCDEPISIKAKKCKHCGEILDPQMRDLERLMREKNNSNINTKNNQGIKKSHHIIHGVLTILTGGFWAFVWIFDYISKSKDDIRTKKHKIIRFIKITIYILFALILLGLALDQFSGIQQPGVNFWSGILFVISAVIILLAAFTAIGWILLTITSRRDEFLPKPKFGLVNDYTIPFGIFILLVVSALIGSLANIRQARELGFSPEMNFSDAKENNIFDANEYSKYLEEKAAKQAEQERIATEEKEKQGRAAAEENAKCLEDANCYANKHNSGDYQCKKAVEESAKYQFEWTDSAFELKFNSYNWYDKDRKIVTRFGDKARAQNGFGAFKNVNYSCTFNADTGEVLYVTID